ncbi:MAG TPA: response regulator [Ktedonobacterales bacterium]
MSSELKTIHIVDDEPDIGLAISMVLEDAGYDVVVLERGADLMRRLQTHALPDLILLDMLLGGQDGRQIVRTLKSDPKTQAIPVVIISAHPMAAHEAVASGADGFMSKPFELDAVLNTVAAHLKSSRPPA